MRIGSLMFEHCGGGLVVVHSDRGQQELRVTGDEVISLEQAAALLSVAERRAEADRIEIERLRVILRGEPHTIGCVSCGMRDEKGIGHFCSAFCEMQDRAVRLAVENRDLKAERDTAQRDLAELRAKQAAFVEVSRG
jgi:hypothetical protein